ncbi:hypothetical protein D9Q98_000649 [Chlorella vulgaris]|uniref:Uncharacterized protein n=1 Tax=Chlorella vulgaris TaxID=3077 RepID=A0A9D4TYT0_CHLVU|nr:hypothetical protein D9Q98_000649 [Chlorella vulgaris]
MTAAAARCSVNVRAVRAAPQAAFRHRPAACTSPARCWSGAGPAAVAPCRVFVAVQRQRRRRLTVPAAVADDGDSEDEEYTDDESGSDYDDEEAGSEAGASKAPADAGFDFQSLPGELTFSQFLAQNSNPEFMDVLNGHPFAMRAMRITWQKEVEAARNGIAKDMYAWQTMEVDGWNPATGSAAPSPLEEEEARAAGTATTPQYEELLAQLPPAVHRQIRMAAQTRVNLPRLERDPAELEYDNDRFLPRKEPELDEWGVRAKMEKRKRQQAERDEWNRKRALVGQYPSLGADWRGDVRCQSTGDPTAPVYREWTQREIWDLITLNGRNADPRDVALTVENPEAISDWLADGGEYRMSPEEYFESRGQLIQEEDLATIVDKDAEVALLASEFSDFDEELASSADFEADGGDDDGF